MTTGVLLTPSETIILGTYMHLEYWSNFTMAVFKGLDLVIVTTIDTHIQFSYIKYFSSNKCPNI